MYQYNATIRRVIDGDTVEATVDLGFRLHTVQRLRLLGINAPERRTSKKAEAARSALERLIPPGTIVRIKTSKSDDWARWLALVFRDGLSSSVNEWMVQNGYAKRI